MSTFTNAVDTLHRRLHSGVMCMMRIEEDIPIVAFPASLFFFLSFSRDSIEVLIPDSTQGENGEGVEGVEGVEGLLLEAGDYRWGGD